MIGCDSRPALSEPTDRLKILAKPPPGAGGFPERPGGVDQRAGVDGRAAAWRRQRHGALRVA